MIGAVIGDIAGERLVGSKGCTLERDFILNFSGSFTDDSVQTAAIAKALMDCRGDYQNLSTIARDSLKEICSRYPYAGYGAGFVRWLNDKELKPFNSFGNGSAMRVSPCAWVAKSLDEVLDLSYKVTVITHNHEEGIKGAQAVAAVSFLALQNTPKNEIKKYITENFYDINFTIDEIRPFYTFDPTCQGSVPQALEAFFESHDFESALLNALSLGGDADTIGAMTGSIAEACYGVPASLRQKALDFLDEPLRKILLEFENTFKALKLSS